MLILDIGMPGGNVIDALHRISSPETVSTYRTRLMEKMGFETTAEIIRYAVKRGLVG